MREAAWYVIQVETGREQRFCASLQRLCDEVDRLSVSKLDEEELLESDLTSERGIDAAKDIDRSADDFPTLEECFSPRFATQRKVRGEWEPIERNLLPGYVIAVTRNVDALAQILRMMPGFARLLTIGETFVPLREDERKWIESYTKEGEHVLPMSMAYKDGDHVVVTSGPLVGREWQIVRINRSKSVAHLEMYIAGKRFVTTVGLGIVKKAETRAGRRESKPSNGKTLRSLKA